MKIILIVLLLIMGLVFVVYAANFVFVEKEKNSNELYFEEDCDVEELCGFKLDELKKKK
jgi:hypothetical protein